MFRLCWEYAVGCHVKFNHLKSKLVCYNVKNVKDVSIQLFGQNIEVVNDVLHLSNYIGNDKWKKNKIKMVQSFYCRSNSILTHFNILKCMDVELSNIFAWIYTVVGDQTLVINIWIIYNIQHIETISDTCLNFCIAHILL